MKTLIIGLILIIGHFIGNAQDYSIKSPDEQIILSISTKDKLSFKLNYKNNSILETSDVDLIIRDKKPLSKSLKVKKSKTTYHNSIIEANIATKSKQIIDEYNELSLKLSNNYKIIFRAYNNGIAYRIASTIDEEIIVENEVFQIDFYEETDAYFPKETSLQSHYERMYIKTTLDSIGADEFCSLPVLMQKNNVNILITEADLYDYPNMFLYGSEGNALNAGFPGYVLSSEPRKGSEDRNQLLETADYIAKTEGDMKFPWRIVLVTDNDKDLLSNNLVYQLSRPCLIEDPSWIKPGKVAWDWYNANNIYGVDFKAGINTETYKYYIDFAHEYNLEYIILDEGWSISTTNIRDQNIDIDIKEIVEYGKLKNVGVILWVLWGPLDKDISVLELYNSWGVKGIKVDFMQRADQYMVNYYEKVAKEAARNKLLLDFHGAYKPSGMRRAYPNIMTYEGLKGNENNKWSDLISPEHNLTIPFIRMVAGPMDFTPGAMINTTLSNHNISFNRPMSLGTRSHQIAMYVVFESPLQMLCDSPTNYYKEKESTDFISRIPSVWDESIVLEASVSDYILMARSKDDIWYIGAMTDWTSRTMKLDLSFLGEGNYSIEIMKDGPNAESHAQDYQKEKYSINNKSIIEIKLASGGGWAAIINKEL